MLDWPHSYDHPGDTAIHPVYHPVMFIGTIENGKIVSPPKSVCLTVLATDPREYPHWRYLACPCGDVLWKLK